MSVQISQQPQFSIKTQHIKALNSNSGQINFISLEPSMFLLQKSLCPPPKTIELPFSKQQTDIISSQKCIASGTARDPQSLNITVSEQDLNKFLTQLISKGKKTENLLKSLIKDKSLPPFRQQFERFAHQNFYLKSTLQMILNEYFKKRRLGSKLRGLNSDLLIQIQNKLFPLIQLEMKLWVNKAQGANIEKEFRDEANKIRNTLQNVQNSIFQ